MNFDEVVEGMHIPHSLDVPLTDLRIIRDYPLVSKSALERIAEEEWF